MPRATHHRFSPLPKGSGCFRFVFVLTKEEKEQR